MKKSIIVILCLFITFSMCACKNNSSSNNDLIPKESPKEDFEYKFDDGTVIITGYIGTDLEIVIPEKIDNRPVTTIDKSAFEDYDMKTIILPDTITFIDACAFKDCDNLINIKLSNNLEVTAGCIFENCDSLEEITLPDSLTNLGYAVFSECTNLKKVTMSNELYEKTKDIFVDPSPKPEYFAVFYNCNPNLEVNDIPLSDLY